MGNLRDQQTQTVCDLNMCNGCNACVTKCPVNAIGIRHEVFSINAIIDTERCIHCNACTRICPNITQVHKSEPIEWKRGWSNNALIRKNGSSGGIVSAIIAGFIGNDNYVCTCIFDKGEFKYVLTNDSRNLENAPGSKYVKSDTGTIFADIRAKLNIGCKVLFVGLPCHVAGIKKYLEDTNNENFYSIDMLCHGTPSKKLFDQFLQEQGAVVSSLRTVSFREKNHYEVEANKQYFSVKGTLDYYSLAFINGVSYTDNCYQCRYATVERISDITVGDSWIEDSYKSEMRNGISLIMVMNEKGNYLLSLADAVYIPDKMEDEIAIKPELSHPTEPLGNLKRFRQDIHNGKRVDQAVIHSLFYKVIKQKVKGMLLQLGILKYREG